MSADAAINNAVDFERWIDNFKAHASDCLRIRDHNTSEIVPLNLNPSQLICDDIAESLLKDFGYVRIMLLKARRFGGSTWAQGRSYSKTSLNQNRNAFIVAHEKESTNTIFEMSKLMHQQNPLPPSTLKNNEKALKFDNEEGTGLKSEYRVATAKNTGSGRSQGVHFLHCSEEAFWNDGERLLKGLLQTVPDPPAYSEIYRESTAQGFGNSFQIDCFKAFDGGSTPYFIRKLSDVAPHMPQSNVSFTFAYKAPGQDWCLVFIPWFLHERYTKPFETAEQRDAFIAKAKQLVFNQDLGEWVDSQTMDLRKRYNLSWEQLNWREWAIENKCRGSEDTFAEEYPATVIEAFLSAGNSVYPPRLCDDLEAQCQEPILRGEPVVKAGKTRVRPSGTGHLKVWAIPEAEEDYFLTVDSGGGKNQRQIDEKADPDPTCIDVYHHRSGIQVAQWHGHIAYDMIADIVEMVGNLYNRCLACVEVMNHGYTVVADLKRAGYPQYEWRRGEAGWRTDRKTKPVMVDDLYRMARDGGVQIRCLETVSEMRTFKEINGSFEAESGCHDERVDCAGMATQMLQMLPRYFNLSQDEPFDLLEEPREDSGWQEVEYYQTG